ncbi:MAG: CAP domain-containing protein, partial [Candidatus Eisenbacteria bacterium]|nr:CAP domain-containing protein [Candidatus Eisenbacteria bacterium]
RQMCIRDRASPFVDPAFQTGILREVNFARTRPADYADLVEQWERYFDGDVLRRPGHLPVVTREGAAAVRGAVRFLREVHPVSPVRLSEGMSWAAVDHVLDQGPRAAVGHEGSDGSQSWDRMERYGEWSGSAGEDIWYGRGNPRDVVIALIVDDGVPARGHRQNLFDPDFRVIGVGCGTHAYYDSMCVLTFAGGYQERAR